jgi:hypothetical protein
MLTRLFESSCKAATHPLYSALSEVLSAEMQGA